jgi:hypothetical protein
LREAEGIGRPLGTAGFLTELERRLGRPIARRAPGRKAVTIPVGEQLNLLQEVSCHRISVTVLAQEPLKESARFTLQSSKGGTSYIGLRPQT